jgi:tetratricopeptide (TPR) repeat protein
LIDSARHPDLVTEFARGTLERIRCPECGRIVRSELPVAVLTRVGDGEVVLLFTDEPEPPADAPAWYARLAARAGGGPRVVPLVRAAAPIVLTRSITDDLGNADAAIEQVRSAHGELAAQQYSHFLENLVHGEDLERAMELIALLMPVEDAAAFTRLVSEQPWILSDEALALVDLSGQLLPGGTANAAAIAALLRAARVDPDEAWRTYSATNEDDVPGGQQEIRDELTRLEALLRGGQFAQVIEEGRAAIERSEAAGNVIAMGFFETMVGQALVQTRTGDRGENLRDAMDHFERAVPTAPTEAIRGERLGNLGLARFLLVSGDTRANQAQATEELATAERLLAEHGDAELLAMVRTNLAFALTGRDSDDRLTDLRRAKELCDLALTYRSPARDATDWAYTQVNLGTVHEGLSAIGAGNVRDARRTYERVIAHGTNVAPGVLGHAHLNLSGLERVAAASARTRLGRRRRLATATRHAERAVELFKDGQDRQAHGRALSRLADLRLDADDSASAVAAAREALEVLPPRDSPSDAQDAAATLGTLFAESESWEEAASAYSDALAAVELMYMSSARASDRAQALERQPRLARWASYTAARAGDVRRAVLTLEDGRSRELRRRIGPEADAIRALADSSPQLHDEYVEALADLAHAELGNDADAAEAHYQRVLTRVRALPGLGEFAASVPWSTIEAATSREYPLVYVNATPYGTEMLFVWRPTASAVRAEAVFLPTTSAQVINQLAFGDEQLRPGATSYLAAIGPVGGRLLPPALDSTLPWVGERICSALSAGLHSRDARGVTLIVSGPLALVPLEAADWREHGQSKTLGDEFVVQYAPSAAVHAECLRRVDSSDPDVSLVALSDPRPEPDDLPAARAETACVRRALSPPVERVAEGSDATARFLLDHAACATHLHLACHAQGELIDFRRSSLQLADGDLELTRLATIGRLRARLVVVSTCQSALFDVTRAPDEAYSLAAIFLTAGAACAVASMWRVDDYATAVLMTRFYEDLARGGTPPESLRRARLWLRDLSPSEHERFVSARPELAAELARRVRVGRPPGETGDAPFAHPKFWAPFVVMGV